MKLFNTPISVFKISQKLNKPPERVEKVLGLFEQEKEAENIIEDNISYWKLTTFGEITAWNMQDDYLRGNENYRGRKLAAKDLTQEHLKLIEYFKDSSEDSPKKLSLEDFPYKKAKDNPYCLYYPQLVDLIESGIIHQERTIGFRYFYLTAKGNMILMRYQGYTLDWGDLSNYQKEVLMVLVDSSPKKSIAYFKFMDNLSEPFHITQKKMDKEIDDLENANLIEHSDQLDEDCSAYYITERGKNLIKKMKS